VTRMTARLPCPERTGQGPVERMAVDQDDALAAANIVICLEAGASTAELSG